jgi:membrane protein YdbS with pleckstrin-like domain
MDPRLTALVSLVVLLVSVLLGVSAFANGEVLVGVFLAVVAVLALVQVVYYLRRYLRR